MADGETLEKAAASGKGPPAQQQAQQAQQAQQQHHASVRVVVMLVACWIVNSAVCVLLNKYVLFYLGFKFPTTLAVLHMASAFLACSALIYLTPDGRRHLPLGGKLPPALQWQLAGVSALFGVVLVLANSAFMYLSVPSIQMLKASGAATTFCVGLAFRTEAYSHRSALKVLVVGAGVAVASYGDVKANLLGVCLQVGSIVCDAVRCTLLQLAMQRSEVKLTPVGTLYYVAPMAAMFLAVPAAAVDAAKLLRHSSPIPWLWLLGSCAAASSLNIIIFTLIGKTSALTTSITGPLKEWVCILAAVVLYGNRVTHQQLVGYSLALVGIFWYQREKFYPQSREGAEGGAGAAGEGEDKAPLLGDRGKAVTPEPDV